MELVIPTGKGPMRPVERPRQRSEDNIVVDLKGIVMIGSRIMVWRALVNAALNFGIS